MFDQAAATNPSSDPQSKKEKDSSPAKMTLNSVSIIAQNHNSKLFFNVALSLHAFCCCSKNRNQTSQWYEPGKTALICSSSKLWHLHLPKKQNGAYNVRL